MLMTIATVLLALALTGGEPAHARAVPVDSTGAKSCIAPARTGTYRVLAVSTKGNEPRAAILLLENIQGCLEVTLVTDASGPAVIDRVSVTENTLKGSLRLSTGTAQVSFQFSDKDVVGSIVEGRREWKLEGRRTS
jgi:siroheme synthase (precorrin-2 oxidase/ferrochelatase)